jgi:hypothetical protein
MNRIGGVMDSVLASTVLSTYANILKNKYKKVRKNVGIG